MKHIALTKGYFATVDDADYEAMCAHKWCAVVTSHDRVYAMRRFTDPLSGRSTYVYMHRSITDAAKGSVVDHKNHNTLDNRRENLRVTTPTNNNRNQRPRKIGSGKRHSKFKGVTLAQTTNPWHAYIKHGAKRETIGYFASEVEAAEAYDREARARFGEFAYTNFAA